MDFGESSVLAVVTLSGCEASGIDVATVVVAVVDIAAEGCVGTGIFAVVVDAEATLVLVATLT